MMTLFIMLEFAPHIHPIVGWSLAALGVIILGIAKSGFGGGVGIVAVPMFAIAFGAQKGTAILLPLLIAADVFSVYHHWGNWDKQVLKVLAPGSLTGILIGAVLLWVLVGMPTIFGADRGAIHLTISPPAATQVDAGAATTPASAHVAGKTALQRQSEDALNLITGVVSVLYVVLDYIRRRVAPNWHFKPNHRSGFAAGAAVGVISTLAHAAGPVAAIFLLNQGLPRALFMGTTVIYFFGINTIKLIPYTVIPGMINWSSIATGLVLIPLAPLGTWIGKWMCDRLSELVFRNTILIIVFVTGLQLTYESLTGVKLISLLVK